MCEIEYRCMWDFQKCVDLSSRDCWNKIFHGQSTLYFFDRPISSVYNILEYNVINNVDIRVVADKSRQNIQIKLLLCDVEMHTAFRVSWVENEKEREREFWATGLCVSPFFVSCTVCLMYVLLLFQQWEPLHQRNRALTKKERAWEREVKWAVLTRGIRLEVWNFFWCR